MSINLHIENSHIDLRQTPTWLTNLALYDYAGNKRYWEETRHIYVSWLRSLMNGSYNSQEEYDFHKESIDSAIEEIMTEDEPEFFGM